MNQDTMYIQQPLFGKPLEPDEPLHLWKWLFERPKLSYITTDQYDWYHETEERKYMEENDLLPYDLDRSCWYSSDLDEFRQHYYLNRTTNVDRRLWKQLVDGTDIYDMSLANAGRIARFFRIKPWVLYLDLPYMDKISSDLPRNGDLVERDDKNRDISEGPKILSFDERRKDLGWSVTYLAEQTHIPQPTLWRILNETRNGELKDTMSFRNYINLVNVLQCPLDRWWGFWSEPDPEHPTLKPTGFNAILYFKPGLFLDNLPLRYELARHDTLFGPIE